MKLGHEQQQQMESFTRDFDAYQLQRAANLIILASSNGEDKLKYMLDKRYRLGAFRLRCLAHRVDHSSRRLAGPDGRLREDHRHRL